MSLSQSTHRRHQGTDNVMEFATIPGTALSVSRVTLGTWAIGGWMWGGTDEAESIATIRAALAHGIDTIDTAPVYGFGRSEEIVGKALADGLRQDVILATKVGLEWHDGKITRNGGRDRIMLEIDDSYAGCAPTASTSIRFTGPTRRCRCKRLPRPCSSFTSRGQFAPSAPAISPSRRWSR
jgi:hypothetical protein